MKKDNTTAIVIVVGALFIALYLFVRNKQIQNKINALAQPAPTPTETALMSGQQPGPLTIEATIANQGLNFLQSNYIPLFGFVGMAQGTMYQ